MPRKVALGLTLVQFLMNGSQANQRRFPYPEYRFPLRRNKGFLTQEYSIGIVALCNQSIHYLY